MNVRVTSISTILNSSKTIRPLTHYEWERNRDQHYLNAPIIIKLLTNFEWKNNKNQHYLNPLTIIRHSHTVEKRVTRVDTTVLNFPMMIRPLTHYNERATNISTDLTSLRTIRPLTFYKWESNKNECHSEKIWPHTFCKWKKNKNEYYSKFSTDNQTAYLLWMREQQVSMLFWILHKWLDNLPTIMIE